MSKSFTPACKNQCYHRKAKCPSISSHSYSCSLPKNHSGDHVACSLEQCAIDIWENTKPKDLKKNISLEQIYQVLCGHRFADWYNQGDFDAHIRGELECKSKEEILDQIKKMFNC